MAEETIKAKVLRVARQDPFLSIEEIANQVNTTARYVRTILSESQVSLMQLRKSYAKRLEQQLQPGKEQRTTEPIYDPHLKVSKIIDPAIAELLKCPVEQKLLRISQLQAVNQIPVFYELTTCAEVTLNDFKGPLRKLLYSNKESQSIKQGESWIEVVPNNIGLSNLLTGYDNQPLLRLCFLLYNEKVPVAVETQWLSAEGILLRNPSGIIEIEMQVGS